MDRKAYDKAIGEAIRALEDDAWLRAWDDAWSRALADEYAAWPKAEHRPLSHACSDFEVP